MLGRILLALTLVGCVNQAKQAVSPDPPEGTGSLSCREIVEQCDSTCGDPFCLNRCTGQGTQEGAGKHATLLDCGQRHSCTDEECMKASCPNEIDACMGAPPAEQPAQAQAPSS